MSQAIVTGGTGFIGARVVDRLLAEGYEVTLLVRDPQRIAERHSGHVGHLVADLARKVPPLPAADLVVHCAADMDMGHGLKAMLPVTVGGTQRMLESARLARVKRFVHVSSQAVYGFDKHYYDADETAPMRRSPYPYCETKRQAELAVWDAARLGLQVTVLRPGFVYGPGDRRTMPEVIKMLRLGQAKALIDWGEFDTGCLHVENCADGIVRAAMAEVAVNQAYNLGDGRILTIRQLVDTLAQRLGVPGPEGNLPYPVAYALGGAIETVWGLLGRTGTPPMSRFLVAMLRRNSGFSIAKARRDLSYVPRRQWEEGLDELLGWCDEAQAIKEAA